MKLYTFCPHCAKKCWGYVTALPETETTIAVTFLCEDCTKPTHSIEVIKDKETKTTGFTLRPLPTF